MQLMDFTVRPSNPFELYDYKLDDTGSTRKGWPCMGELLLRCNYHSSRCPLKSLVGLCLSLIINIAASLRYCYDDAKSGENWVRSDLRPLCPHDILASFGERIVKISLIVFVVNVEGDVRLIGGSNATEGRIEGRVEIYHKLVRACMSFTNVKIHGFL